MPRSLSGFGLGPRRGESRCQPRRRRGVWRAHTTSRQRRMAARLASARRVGSTKGACGVANARRISNPAALCALPAPFVDPTRAQPKARQAPSCVRMPWPRATRRRARVGSSSTRLAVSRLARELVAALGAHLFATFEDHSRPSVHRAALTDYFSHEHRVRRRWGGGPMWSWRGTKIGYL